LGGLIKDLDGELRAPTEAENIFYTRLHTGVRKGGQILSPTGRVRYLGLFTAMSDDVDESQKQRLRKIATRNAGGRIQEVC
jgi:hypothetical protein